MLFKGKLLVSLASIGVVGGVGVGAYHYQIKNINNQGSEKLTKEKKVPTVLPQIAPQIAPRIEIPLSQPGEAVSKKESNQVVVPNVDVIPNTDVVSGKVVDTKVIDTNLNTSQNSETNASSEVDGDDKKGQEIQEVQDDKEGKEDQEDEAEDLIDDSEEIPSEPLASETNEPLESSPVATDKKESIEWKPLVPATISPDFSSADKSNES